MGYLFIYLTYLFNFGLNLFNSIHLFNLFKLFTLFIKFISIIY